MIPAPKEEESPALGPAGVHGPSRARPGAKGLQAASVLHAAFPERSGRCAIRSSFLVTNS